MSASRDFVAQRLVRSFSHSLKESQESSTDKTFSQRHLEGALISETECEDKLADLLKRANSTPETSSLLRDRFAELEATVKAFIEAFPDIGKENASSKSLTWASLNHTIAHLKTQHETRQEKGFSGKTKKQFHRVCESMNNHMAFLKLMPKDEKYTAPICGTLELIVKASVNHERVGDEFAAAMKEIDDIVAAVNRELSRQCPPFVIDLSVQLCDRILKFLAFPLRWYTQKRRKRLFSSFNENLSAEYQTHVAEIRRISDNIQRGVRHCFELEMMGMGRKCTDLVRYMEDMCLSLQRDAQKRTEEHWTLFHTATEEQMRRMDEERAGQMAIMSQLMTMVNSANSIGPPIKQLMEGRAQQFTGAASAERTLGHSTSSVQEPPAAPSVNQLSSTGRIVSRVEAEDAGAVLNEAFDYGRIEPQDPEGCFFVESEVALRLQIWTTQKTPAFLGILGPATFSKDDPSRTVVSRCIRAARGAGIPCISYFCTLAHEDPPPGRTRATVETVGLLYALIKQLLLYLPPQLPSVPVLFRYQFDELDGTLRSWEAALSLFANLIKLTATSYLLVAVHGFELLESQHTVSALKNFVRILRTFIDGKMDGDATSLKVLLATSGMSRTLGEEFCAGEICDISRGSAARRVGGSGRGRQRLGIVDFAQD